MLVTLFALLPITAAAQGVKLAEWNMETSDDIAVTWFKDGKPQIAPDECVGEKTDYVLTGWSEGRYWQLCTGYQNKVLRIENAAENATMTTQMLRSIMCITRCSSPRKVTKTSQLTLLVLTVPMLKLR